MTYRQRFNMYKYFISKHITKGLLDDINQEVPNDKMVDSYDKLIKSNYVYKLYQISDTPKELELSLITMIKSKRKSGMFLDFYTYMERKPVQWNTPYMKRVEKAWNKRISGTKRNIDDLEKLHTREDYEEVDKRNLAVSSWNYISSKTKNGSETIKTEIVIGINYNKNLSLKEITMKEEDFILDCSTLGITVTPIKKNIRNLLASISPCKSVDKQPIINYSMMLEENISLMSPYMPGKLRGSSIFVGLDIITNTYAFLDLTETYGGALNMMILGKTGVGKSFYIKFLIFMLLANFISVIIWDKDGEYKEICNEIDVPVINLGYTGGKYYNTMVIDDTGDEDSYSKSISETIEVFNLLVDIDNGMDSDKMFIFNKAYTKYLKENGIVKEDKKSWCRSKSLTYEGLYENIISLKDELPKDLEESYNSLIRTLYIYFDKEGLQYGLFDESIDITDILYTKLENQPIVLCINMQTKTKKGDKPSLIDRLKSLTMSNITFRIVEWNRRQNELTALIVEEVVRHIYNKGFVEILSDVILAGRKLNMIPILVATAIDSLVSKDNPEMRDIMYSIDTIIAGGLESDALKLAIEVFKLENCKDVLNQIQEDNKSENKNARFRNAFLFKNKSDYAVVKALIPDNIGNTDMFITRTK